MKSRAEKERTKIQEKQVIYNTIAHYLLTSTQLLSIASEPQLIPLSEVLQVYLLDLLTCGMEYSFGQLRPAVLALVPHSFLCLCSVAERGELKKSSAQGKHY